LPADDPKIELLSCGFMGFKEYLRPSGYLLFKAFYFGFVGVWLCGFYLYSFPELLYLQHGVVG
jgi:hypothetical protein